MPDDELVFLPAEPQVHTAADAARVKGEIVAAAQPAHWRADLWADAAAAIAFANEPPLALPGQIIFTERDNGQVWTFLLTGSPFWNTRGLLLGQDIEATSNYRMISSPGPAPA